LIGNHQIIFERINGIMNLADVALQTCISDYCEKHKVEILFLDNLSCLVSGVDENAASDHEKLQPWLLSLRRKGVTVIFIHHAGRSRKGENLHMRGTTKREDSAAWVISLNGFSEEDESDGARFVTKFDKWRCEKRPKAYEWHFKKIGDEIDVKVKEMGNLALLRDFLENCDDPVSNKEICDYFGWERPYVSNLARKAQQDGWLKKTEKGKFEIVADAPF
jgi:hypothetical protein